MSKVGRRPINIPENIQIEQIGNKLSFKGPLGEASLTIPDGLTIEKVGTNLKVLLSSQSKKELSKLKSLHGLFARLISNQIQGLSAGFEKKLQLKGIGYRAELRGEDLVLNLGRSHPILIKLIPPLKVTVEKNIITVRSPNIQQVGDFAARIRGLRPADPYKGKGIRYFGEEIKLKPGKSAKAIGPTT